MKENIPLSFAVRPFEFQNHTDIDITLINVFEDKNYMGRIGLNKITGYTSFTPQEGYIFTFDTLYQIANKMQELYLEVKNG